jgi:hypothetical protein
MRGDMLCLIPYESDFRSVNTQILQQILYLFTPLFQIRLRRRDSTEVINGSSLHDGKPIDMVWATFAWMTPNFLA